MRRARIDEAVDASKSKADRRNGVCERVLSDEVHDCILVGARFFVWSVGTWLFSLICHQTRCKMISRRNRDFDLRRASTPLIRYNTFLCFGIESWIHSEFFHSWSLDHAQYYDAGLFTKIGCTENMCVRQRSCNLTISLDEEYAKIVRAKSTRSHYMICTEIVLDSAIRCVWSTTWNVPCTESVGLMRINLFTCFMMRKCRPQDWFTAFEGTNKQVTDSDRRRYPCI